MPEARFVFFREESTAEGGPRAEHRENIRGGAHAVDDFGFARAGEIRVSRLGNGDIRKGVNLLLPDAGIRQVGVQQGIELGELRHDFADQVELLRIRIGEGAKQSAVHYRENRGVSADAEGQREDGDDGEAGAAAQLAQAEADVLEQSFCEVHAAGFAAGFFHLIEAAEFEARAAHGFLAREAGLDVMIHLLIKMEAQFVIEIILESAAVNQGPQACGKIAEHRALLRRLQHLGDGFRQLFPFSLFRSELFAAAGGELVKLRAAIVFGGSPASLDPAAFFQPVKGGI